MSMQIRAARSMQKSGATAIKLRSGMSPSVMAGATGAGGRLTISPARGFTVGQQTPFDADFVRKFLDREKQRINNPPPPPTNLPLVAGGTTGTTPSAPGLTDTICQHAPSYLQGLCKTAGGYIGGQFGPTSGNGSTACPPGKIKMGDKCVAPGDAFPGGDPLFTGAGGVAVQGSFGLPGVTPLEMQRRHLKCPPGMVLGKDEVCYPKAILPRRSGFRKWKGDRRPPVSVSDMQAIRQAARAQGRVKKLASQVGFSTKKR